MINGIRRDLLMMARYSLMLALAGSVCAWGQSALSAHSGMIHYVEGKVLLEGQPVDPKFGEFPEVKNNEVLQTEEGRAEVLLTPGVFLRVAENSSFRMLSNRLSDTAFEVLSGSTLIEVDELLKDNAITVKYKDATVSLTKHGLYRFDVEAARMRVYDGDAQAIYAVKTVEVHKGRQVLLDETLATTSFDTKDTDAFYNWASRRGEYVAAANISSARAAGQTGLGGQPCGGGFATTNNGVPCNSGYGNYGSYGYGSPYGMWAWNPYYGMFTYLPGIGYGYSPFGWALYSPYTVGSIFVPGMYSPYASAPRYSSTASGPTALSGARQSPASLSSGGASPIRAASPGAGPATTASSAPARSAGGGTSGGGAAPSGGGGGSMGAGSAHGGGAVGGGGHK
jgi:hypothetical protein